MRSCSLCKKKFLNGCGSCFKVPTDPAKRSKWSALCGKELKKYSVLCSDHFPAYSLATTGSRISLLANAEPTITPTTSHKDCLYVPQRLRDRKNPAKEVGTSFACTSQASKTTFPSSFAGANGSTSVKSGTTGVSSKGNTKLFSWEELAGTATVPVQLPEENLEDASKEQNSQTQKNVAELKHTILYNYNQVFDKNLSNSNINFIPPQLEEPIVQLREVKKAFCSGYTQTNIRLCGLVEASDFADEFRFSCFYCSRVFPLEKWKNFVQHLKESHFEEEEAFKTSKYLSKEHDYTPISLPPPLIKSEFEPVAYISETALSTLEDPLGSVENPFEPTSLNFNLYNKKTNFVTHRLRQNSKINKNSYNKNSKRMVKSASRFYSKLSKQQTLKRSALSRCLKRTIEENIYPTTFPSFGEDEDENIKTDSFTADPENPTEISFEYSPRLVVNLLLDSMKNFPLLWHFDNEPFNEDFFEAVEELCNVINNNFFLNIDNLKMRRSINRILRFYCHVFPNENNHQFTYYYNKCVTFLPSVNEIAYARCPHCYVCYESDYDLKLHLAEEQKYLEWPYKCSHCKECFRLWNESVLHKHLPHYDEIFRCQPCKLSFFRRLSYKKHMVEEHQSINEPGRFKCDICDRSLESLSGLRYHKKTHGERQHNCHLCPKSYHAKSKLDLHLKIHRQEHDFMCEVCGKKFIRQPALKIHMTKHTGEKVTCKICGLRLRKSSLGRHLRICHVVKTGPGAKAFFSKGKQISLSRLLRAKPKGPIQKKRGSERNYTCKICKISLDNYKLTVQHNKELHSDIPMWPCQLCSTEFNAKINLKRHYRKKHKLHTLQTYKLVEENEDLDVVLSIKAEDIDEIYESLRASRYNPESTKIKSDDESPTKNFVINSDHKLPTKSTKYQNELIKSEEESITKTDLLPDEMYFSEEKFHSSAIQDEIMKAVGDIETEDMKIDYIDDMFTDILQ